MAEDLDISPLAAEIILQTLRPVVHDHYDVEEAGTGFDELDVDDGDAMTVDTLTEPTDNWATPRRRRRSPISTVG